MPHFTVTFVLDDGRFVGYNFESFADVASHAIWKHPVKSIEMNFTPAVPDMPLFFQHLYVDGDELRVGSVEASQRIKIGPNMVRDILESTENSMKAIYSDSSPNSLEMREHFATRNERLFEMFDPPEPQETDASWGLAVAALAAAGLAGVIKKKKAQAALGRLEQQMGNQIVTEKEPAFS